MQLSRANRPTYRPFSNVFFYTDAILSYVNLMQISYIQNQRNHISLANATNGLLQRDFPADMF